MLDILLRSTLFNSLLLASLLALSHVILKWVSIQSEGGLLAHLRQLWPYLALSLSIYGFVFFYYSFILRFQDLNVLYPLYTGLSILLVFTLGVVLFAEPLTRFNIAGALFIIGGIALLGYK